MCIGDCEIVYFLVLRCPVPICANFKVAHRHRYKQTATLSKVVHEKVL